MNGDESIESCLEIKTDFEEVNKSIEKIRKKSLEYLRIALNDEGSTDF